MFYVLRSIMSDETVFENMPPKKSHSKLIAIIIVILVVGALGYVFYDKNKDKISRPKIESQTKEKDLEEIEIVREEGVYGISGTILEVHKNSIVIETVAMPYGSFKPSPGNKWTWTVSIHENTEIAKLTMNENIEEAVNKDENFIETSATKSSLIPGNFVTITSSDDISIEFPTDEKNIIANKIEIY